MPVFMEQTSDEEEKKSASTESSLVLRIQYNRITHVGPVSQNDDSDP